MVLVDTVSVVVVGILAVSCVAASAGSAAAHRLKRAMAATNLRGWLRTPAPTPGTAAPRPADLRFIVCMAIESPFLIQFQRDYSAALSWHDKAKLSEQRVKWVDPRVTTVLCPVCEAQGIDPCDSPRLKNANRWARKNDRAQGLALQQVAHPERTHPSIPDPPFCEKWLRLSRLA